MAVRIRNSNFIKNSNLELLLSSLIFYLIAQGFGLLCAKRILSLPGLREQLVSQQPIPWWSIILAIIFATLFILFFLKVVKKRAPYRIFFGILFFFGVFLTLNIWLAAVPALVISIILFYFYQRCSLVILHNLIIVLAITWAAVLLGFSFSSFQIIIILLLLSIYDMIAVWKTKHMVKMFTGLARQGVIFALIMPSKASFLLEKVPDLAKIRPPILSKVGPRKFLFLGTGDIALPMVLAVSVLARNIWSSILIIVGALAGIVFIHFVFLRKERQSLPALPPLALGAILGWLISKMV